MPDDSLEILWRGSDPAKFTALQAALRGEEIRFVEMLAHDHAGGFLNMRPYYMEAMPGFEIRVSSSDLPAAQLVLESIDKQEAPRKLTTCPDTSGKFPSKSRRSCRSIGTPAKRLRKSGPVKTNRRRNTFPVRSPRTASRAAFRTIPAAGSASAFAQEI